MKIEDIKVGQVYAWKTKVKTKIFDQEDFDEIIIIPVVAFNFFTSERKTAVEVHQFCHSKRNKLFTIDPDTLYEMNEL